jgi:hypothetical protein
MRKFGLAGVLLVALLATVGIVAAGGRPLAASLSGANEVPSGSGDPDGRGSARLTLNQGQGELCVDIDVENISNIRLAHIHEAPAGVNGPVVVDFGSLISGLTVEGCVPVDAALIKEIRQNPENYYVNIHSNEFPAGAVRGQLSR